MAASLRCAVVCASLLALPGGFPAAHAQENAPAQRLVAEPWKTPPPPVLSTGGFAGVSHGRLLLAGRAPDAATETPLSVWTFPATPSPGTNERWKPANVTVPAWTATTPWRDGLIVAGGLLGGKPTGQVVLLTVNGDTVTASPLPPLPRPLAGAGAAVVGTKLYVFGGVSSVESPELEKTLWTLAPGVAGGAWHEETGQVFPATGRAFAAVAGQYGALCVAGGVTGEDGAFRPSRETWIFRPTPPEGTQRTGWERLADAPTSLVHAAAVPLGQAHVLFVGGERGEREDGLFPAARPADAGPPLLFHTVLDAWSICEGLPAAPDVRAVILDDGGVLLVGNSAQRLTFPRSARTLALVDWLMVAAYFALIVTIGWYFSRKQESSEEFSLGNRQVAWWAAGISMFATGASAISFMAIPALAFSANLFYLFPLVTYIPAYFVTAYLIFPLLRRMNLTSTYEYLEHRFNRPLRLLASAQCILLQSVGRAGVVLMLPALAISAVTGMNVLVSVLLMGLLTTVYTALGGFEAVIWTEVFQGILKFVAPLVMIAVAIAALPGGFGEFMRVAQTAHKFDYAVWTWDMTVSAAWVLLLNIFLTATISVAGDQPIIQRVFSSPMHEVRRVNMMSTACGIVIGAIVNFLGIAIFCYFHAHPEKFGPAVQTDQIVPYFTTQAMPVGFAGLVVAAIFASAMATVASAMNSVATIFTEDFYMKLRPDATDRQRLRTLRTTSYVVGLVGTGTALLLASRNLNSMMVIWSQIITLLGGGVVGVYSLGMFTRRANSFGALVGAVVSIFAVLLVKLFTPLHWSTYGPISILSCVGVGYLASFLAPKPTSLDGLTVYTPMAPRRSRAAGIVPGTAGEIADLRSPAKTRLS